MRQIRITTANFTQPSDDDCYLSPDDPIHDLKKTAMLGGLGIDEAMASYNRLSTPVQFGNNRGQVAREQGIQPGTEAWFKHWFSKPNLTGEK